MNNSQRNTLESFLFASKNSHAKESLINNKLFFDLKMAAASCSYFLSVYTPEVDKDGFDVIFDDQEVLAKIQLKTVMKKAGTSSWNIHKGLLRPTEDTCDDFGFEFSPEGVGYGGGIILMEIDTEKEFCVEYFYTDIFVLCGIRNLILDLSKPPSKSTIMRVFKDLQTGNRKEKISINKSFFVKAKDPIALLALMGLNGGKHPGMWRYHLKNIVSPFSTESELDIPVNRPGFDGDSFD